MKARAVPEGTKTVEDQLKEELEYVEKTLLGEEPDGLMCIESSTVRVRRQYREEGDLVTDPEEEFEEIAVQDFVVEPARTGLRVGHTINMGQYWSLQVQVEVSVPCYREELPQAFDFAAKFAVERLQREIERGKERTQERRGSGTTDTGFDGDQPF